MAMLIKPTTSMLLRNAFKTLSSNLKNSASCVKKFSAETLPTIPSAEEAEEVEFQNQEKEKFIEMKRNVSRLNPEHRNIVHGNPPYPEPKSEVHVTVKYRRKMYGKYGNSSGVNPGIMWPTKEDISARKEYESVAYPFTIQDMVKAELSKKEEEEASLLERQKKIQENMKKLEKWITDLQSKRAKKIHVAAQAKAKNDRLIEEVRRHFGYTVDHREERFQQLLEQKQREEKKLIKMEKKKKREEMLLQDLISVAQKEEAK